MTAYYSINPKFYVSVDCIIFGFDKGELKLLLQKRRFAPAAGQWSLVGGFVKENESVEDAAKRVLFELTGLTDVYIQQVATFGEVERDPGERVISVAYYALIDVEMYDTELLQKYNCSWTNVNELPPIIFDHPQMIEQARQQMKEMASVKPVGFNLLPEYFTLKQLQDLFEAIHGKALDKRNFRKRVADMDFIEKTEQIDKSGSRRGAHLYKFNGKAYRKDPKFKL